MKRLLFKNRLLIGFWGNGVLVNPLSHKGVYFFSQRSVEYSWVLQNLDLHRGRVLDVGCCESALPLWLAHQGLDVHGIDVRDYSFESPEIIFNKEDICNNQYPDEFFDRIITLSTIEHVGMGAYGDPHRRNGDLFAMKEMKRILKKNGMILLTTQYSQNYFETWERYYDNSSLERLVSIFDIEKKEFFVSLNPLLYMKVRESRCEKGVVCLALRKR